jgi:hypothetical protein
MLRRIAEIILEGSDIKRLGLVIDFVFPPTPENEENLVSTDDDGRNDLPTQFVPSRQQISELGSHIIVCHPMLDALTIFICGSTQTRTWQSTETLYAFAYTHVPDTARLT